MAESNHYNQKNFNFCEENNFFKLNQYQKRDVIGENYGACGFLLKETIEILKLRTDGPEKTFFF